MTPAHRQRRTLARGVAAVAGIAMALLLAEGLLRLLDSRDAGLRGLHEIRTDRAWLYGLKPGARAQISDTGEVRYEINADGFRDRVYARPKPSFVFRIVVLGDSVSFGYGVSAEQTFVKLLEQDLATVARAVGMRIEVLNLGVSGYNPYTEAALFDDIGVTYDPDLVLVQFCVNDLNDPTRHFDASTAVALGEIPLDAYPDPAARPPPDPLPLRLCARSQLCSRLAAVLDVSLTSREADVATLVPRAVPSEVELDWLGRTYGRIAKAAAAHGARFALVVFPYETQLAPSAKGADGDDGGDALQRSLRALGERDGFPVIDLLPSLRSEKQSGEHDRLFVDLWHPSARGHRVAAEALSRALEQDRLVPGGASSS